MEIGESYIVSISTMKKCIFILIILSLLLTSCGKIEVIKGELPFKGVGFSPSKLILELGSEQHIEYTITNYRDNDIRVELRQRGADYTESGYETYKANKHPIWVVIPEKEFIVASGDNKKVEVIIGLPRGYKVEENIEMWISMKASNYDMGNELLMELTEINSRILIKKGGEMK